MFLMEIFVKEIFFSLILQSFRESLCRIQFKTIQSRVKSRKKFKMGWFLRLKRFHGFLLLKLVRVTQRKQIHGEACSHVWSGGTHWKWDRWQPQHAIEPNTSPKNNLSKVCAQKCGEANVGAVPPFSTACFFTLSTFSSQVMARTTYLSKWMVIVR